MFRRLLIANRGEIAVRIIRACRDVGIESVAVYSDADARAPHATLADHAVRIGPAPALQSYLSIDAILRAASDSGAEAVHPGYGFLAENHSFAEACGAAGLTFVGPPADAIARLGSKIAARQVAIEAGIPVVPGDTPVDQTDAAVADASRRIGFPVLIKPSEGGGGIGMKTVRDESSLLPAVAQARREALAAFGDGTLYVEKLIERPRHVEVQVLVDGHGQAVHLFERECSLQRRHQKVVEEAPSTALTSSLRTQMGEAAVALARAAGYRNAGTVEFLLDGTGDGARFYFLEMNTRLQVEHPITETVTGVDLVQWQITIARGERLTLDGESLLTPRGHAIECRIYAEDPEHGFLPSPGRIQGLRVPQGPGVRDDSGAYEGGEVPIFYDPMISKLITWGDTRDHALQRMRRALAEYEVRGIRTTIPFFKWLLEDEDFKAGRFDTSFIDRKLGANGATLQAIEPAHEDLAAIAAAVHMFTRPSAANATVAHAPSRWRDAGRVDALR